MLRVAFVPHCPPQSPVHVLLQRLRLLRHSPCSSKGEQSFKGAKTAFCPTDMPSVQGSLLRVPPQRLRHPPQSLEQSKHDSNFRCCKSVCPAI